MSIKKNFAYNILLTLLSYIAALILFPYVSRTLGVNNIGIIGFVDNIVNYFVLMSSLGIATVGIREIASCGENITKRSEVFINLLIFSLVLTGLFTLVYIIAIISIPSFTEYRLLLYIGISKILFSSLLIEWFYTGIEQFKYVTIRSIIVRIMYVISVFTFVRKPEDYVIYFLLTVATIILNSFVNIIHSSSYITFSLVQVNLKRYYSQVFSFGVYNILTSLYTTFNVVYLGFACTKLEVGYYYTSTKIFYIILGIFSAFTGVMLPRMSSLLSKGQITEFNIMMYKSFTLIFSICFPIIIFCIILAPQIINLLAGSSYQGAIMPMQIIMPIILVTGIAQILVIQVLTPLRKDKIIIIASIIGAAVGISLNLLLVKKFGAIGSAIVLLLSDLCADLFCLFYLTKEKIVKFPINMLFYNLIASMPYVIICYLSTHLSTHPIIIIFNATIFSTLYFLICQILILKNELITNLLITRFKHLFPRKFLK